MRNMSYTNNPAFVWNGTDTIYITQMGYTGNGVLTYSKYNYLTNTWTDGCTITAAFVEQQVVGMWYSGGIFYRAATYSGAMFIQHGTETGNTMTFSGYGTAVTPTGLTLTGGNRFLAWLVSNTQFNLISVNQNSNWSFTFSGGFNVSGYANNGAVTNYISGGVGYNYTTLSYICDSLGNPIAPYSIFNPANQIPGFPSTPVLMYVKALVSTANLYIQAVASSSPLAPYVQFSLSPTGPWVTEINIGAIAAGQIYPFYGRVYPPSGLVPAGYVFNVSMSINP